MRMGYEPRPTGGGGGNATVTSALTTSMNTSAQAFIDDLLTTLATSAAQSGTLDISGAGKATPTHDVSTVTGVYVTTFINNSGNDFGVIQLGNGRSIKVWGSDEVNYTDSSFTAPNAEYYYVLQIGIGDSPTTTQSATKGAALVNGGLIPGVTATSSTNTLTITVATDALLPCDLQDPGGGVHITISETRPGDPSHNAAVRTLRGDLDWTITTN